MNILKIFSFVSLVVLNVNCAGQVPVLKTDNKFEDLSYGVVALVQPSFASDGITSSDPTDLEIHSRNSSGEEHDVYCSGFFIKDNTIMTAAHCVQRMELVLSLFGAGYEAKDESPVGDLRKISTYAQYKDSQGRFTEYKLVKVVKYDRKQDLALLELLPNQSAGYHLNFNLGAAPRLGDKVSAIGHPSGLAWTLTQGIVSSEKRDYDGQLILQTSTMTFFGNSGCPLIDSNGNAVGVASMIARTPHLALYTHVDSMKIFVD